MSDEKMMPCPFCGGMAAHEFEIWLTKERHWVSCDNEDCLDISTGIYPTAAEAIAAWNTRVAHPPQARDEVQRLAWPMAATIDRVCAGCGKYIEPIGQMVWMGDKQYHVGCAPQSATFTTPALAAMPPVDPAGDFADYRPMAELLVAEFERAAAIKLSDVQHGHLAGMFAAALTPRHLLLASIDSAEAALATLPAGDVPTDAVERLAEAIVDAACGIEIGLSYNQADVIARAVLSALPLRAAAVPEGYIVVPRDATDAALAMVVPEPTHLYLGRDQNYINRMKAATAADRLTVASHYRTVVDAMSAAPARGPQEGK